MPRAPVCPFFARTKRDEIICSVDGPDAGTEQNMALRFPEPLSRKKYWTGRCCGDWRGCSLAYALWDIIEEPPPELTARICIDGVPTFELRSYNPPKSAAWRTEKGLAKLEQWARQGLNWKQIAARCGCGYRTLRKWMYRYPDIAEAFERGGGDPFRKGKSAPWREDGGLKKIESWARQGLCDAEIARKCKVNRKIFFKWKTHYPEIVRALENGRRSARI